jgi:hypothetical protein
MFYPDFEEFIESLNARRVKYLIIGGYAVQQLARKIKPIWPSSSGPCLQETIGCARKP